MRLSKHTVVGFMSNWRHSPVLAQVHKMGSIHRVENQARYVDMPVVPAFERLWQKDLCIQSQHELNNDPEASLSYMAKPSLKVTWDWRDAQQLWTLTLGENLSLDPSTLIGQRTTACNSAPRDVHVSLSLCGHLHTLVHMHTHKNTSWQALSCFQSCLCSCWHLKSPETVTASFCVCQIRTQQATETGGSDCNRPECKTIPCCFLKSLFGSWITCWNESRRSWVKKPKLCSCRSRFRGLGECHWVCTRAALLWP